MAFNTLDGTLISPFSNITLARFGGWQVDINLDTEGIQDFLLFPTISVIFEIRSDLDVKLYTIQFINGVVTEEWDNTNGFVTDSSLFQMKGKYDSTTSVFSFSAHPDAVIASGAKFWIYAQFAQTAGGPEFNTISSYVNGTQHPFQYTDGGAVNGAKQTDHLITSPKRVTIQTPYLEQEDSVFEHFRVGSGWVSGKEPLIPFDENAIIGARVNRNIRASQPFHLKAEWGRGGSDPNEQVGDVAIQNILVEGNLDWVLNIIRIQEEHPTCDSAGIKTLPDNEGGTVSHAITGTDAGDNETILMPLTSTVLTFHQIQVLADGDGFGTGVITCVDPPPDEDLVFTKYLMSSVQFVDAPYGFNKWQEI